MGGSGICSQNGSCKGGRVLALAISPSSSFVPQRLAEIYHIIM